jgi:hypothetical protein
VEKTLYGKVFSKIEDGINSLYPRPSCRPAAEGNLLLAQRIQSGTPFFAGRLGTTENNNLSWNAKFHRVLRLPFAQDLREGSWTAAGLFPPTSEILARWSRLCEEALALTDLYFSWGLSMDGYYRRKHLAKAEFADLGTLDAFQFDQPWTLALAGKRVLVVHPFARTIETQYVRHRQDLFGARPLLPEFDLKTVKTPQTIAGNTGGFASWFEAFDRTRDAIDAAEYDIALVGAGSYGMPLSAHIRRAGKSVVYVGGVLQVFFGIRGARWDNSGLYNDLWVRPQPEDQPKNFQAVEGGCYW